MVIDLWEESSNTGIYFYIKLDFEVITSASWSTFKDKHI